MSILNTLKFVAVSLSVSALILLCFYSIDNLTIGDYKTFYVCIFFHWALSFLFLQLSKLYGKNIFYKYNVAMTAYFLLLALESFDCI